MPVLGALLSLLVTLGPIVLVVLLLRRGAMGGVDGRGVRRAFQYGLLLALVVLVAVGLADLLALALGRPVPGEGELARTLAFALVGTPLLAVVVWWNRRTSRKDRTEHEQAGWAVYTTTAAVVSLGVAVAATQTALAAALDARLDETALAGALVWAGVWLAHLVLERRTVQDEHRVVHDLLGSVIGLVLVCVGLIGASAEIGARVVGRSEAVADALARPGALELVALAVVGAGVWTFYWFGRLRRRAGTTAWTAYVLPLGVGAATVTLLTGASLALYHLAVWLVGQAGAVGPHFAQTPGAVAAVLVGAAVWVYHRRVLLSEPGARAAGRTEMVRVHEYLLAGIGLVAAAVGVVRLVDAFAAGLADGSGPPVRGVLGALTLVVVGLPVWLTYWRSAQRAARTGTAAEVVAPSRRVYLVVLFGLSAVVAVGALIGGAYVVLVDALGTGATTATLRDLGVPVGLLLVAAAISGQHGRVLSADRGAARLAEPRRRGGPRDVVLVGPPDRSLVDPVHRLTGAHVTAWPGLVSPATTGVAGDDATGGLWTTAHVLAAVQGHEEPRVVVVAVDAHLEAVGTAR